MSTSLGPTESRRQPLLLCAVVSVVIVGGCLWFQHYWDQHGFPHLARHLGSLSFDGLAFIGIMVPYLLFAVALAIWGVNGRHRLAGAAGAVLAGLANWGLQEFAQHWMFERNHLSQSTLRFYDWVTLLTIPTLLALAWCLARRRGAAWILGLALAPILSAVHHELFLHSGAWQRWEFGHQQWWERALVFVAPAIIAALASWALELLTRRQAEPEATTSPEMQPSA